MAFNHTAYAHRTGRRSKPRDESGMMTAVSYAQTVLQTAARRRHKHRYKGLVGRSGDLQTSRSCLEKAMLPIRQEIARLPARDAEFQRRWGPLLRRVARDARAEKRRLMKMLGEWG